jgi:hypothetical protein
MHYIPDRLVGLRQHISPHRITNTPGTPDLIASILLGVIDLSIKHGTLSEAKCRALAEIAIKTGMACYRNGHEKVGNKCFDAAKNICTDFRYPHNNIIVRWISKLIGISNTETAIWFIRKIVRS